MPQNVSKYLIPKLENIVSLSENPNLNNYDPQKGNKNYQQLNEIIEKLSMIGN